MPSLGRLLTTSVGVAVALLAPVAGAGAGAAGPDDPAFEDGLQWGLAQIDAPGAWGHGTGAGVTIAVVDSGVDLDHEELRSRLVGDVSCIGADGAPDACRGSGQDVSGHGTHVAGIALAEAGNGRGIAGVAPDADLLAVRVLVDRCDDRSGCSPTGSAADVAAGIRWAVAHDADVINLSLGGPLEADGVCVVCDAVDDAWAWGTIAVVAADRNMVLPRRLTQGHAVLVTATTRAGGLASYAAGPPRRGARWLIAAPGGETERDAADCATGGAPQGVLSTHWVPGGSDRYACQAGTSMAAPHVSGALAVLLAQGRSPHTAVERLLGTARPLGAAGGAGLIDLERAAGDGPADAATALGDVSPAPASGLAQPLQPAPFTAPPSHDEGLPRGPLLALAVALIVVGAIVRHRVGFDDDPDHD